MKRCVKLLLFILPVVQNQNNTTHEMYHLEPMDDLDIAMEFPRLEDVLPNLVRKTPINTVDVPDAVVKNITIDLDKIDIEKLKRKLGTVIDKFPEEELNQIDFNASRRQAILDSERHGSHNYMEAAEVRNRRKVMDLMLQTLYMARHKVKLLQSNKHFTMKDTGFRIAFTYRRLGRLFNKLMRIYTYSVAKKHYYEVPNSQIVLHSKASRIHVDFVYLWWVLIKVDAKYRAKSDVHRKTAASMQDMNRMGGIKPQDLNTGRK